MIIGCVSLILHTIGCSQVVTQKDIRLENAKKIYSTVSEHQGFPTENLLRCDWFPWHYDALEATYLYIIPYIPYLIANSTVVSIKEGLYLPTGVFTGGSEFQDKSDHWLKEHLPDYEEIFKATWRRQKSHANFVNMDDVQPPASNIKY
jgi:hypothetical protein